MAKKIRCVILRKNRSVEVKNVSTDVPHFISQKMLYTLPSKAVNFAFHKSEKRKINQRVPELIFPENNPLPISVSGDKTGANDFLEVVVIENILKQTSKPRGMFWELLMTYATDPAKLFMLVIILIIAAAAIGGFLHA